MSYEGWLGGELVSKIPLDGPIQPMVAAIGSNGLDGITTAVEIVERNLENAITTYVNVNNHYEGSAPVTIERFLDALREKEKP